MTEVQGIAVEADDPRRRGIGRLRLLRRWPGRPPLVAVAVLGLVVFTAFFAGMLAPHNPTQGVLGNRLLPPAWAEGGSTDHLLGTDRLGRDIFSRILHGSRISLTLSLVTIFISGTLGTIVGLVGGYFGGRVDALFMRLTDAALSLPLILVAIVLAVLFGPSYTNLILVLGFLLWPRYARQIRGETLAVKEQDFVSLARVAGASRTRIIARHIFPNIVPTLLVLVTYQVGYVIILESSLSFLGVGIPPPTPAWGIMVSEGREYLRDAWWLSLFPGIAIFLTVMSMNMLGDWVRDRLDPKLRQL